MNEIIRKGKGVVIFFKVYADYGFIFDEQYPEREDNVFYHTNSFDLHPDYDEVQQEYKLRGRGTKVIYEAEKGDKGWKAVSVELAQEELDAFGSELTEKEQAYLDEEKETLDVVAEEEETVEEIEEIEEVEIENQEGV